MLSFDFDLGRRPVVWNAKRTRIMKRERFVGLLVWVLGLFLGHFLLSHFLKRFGLSEGVELRSQPCGLHDLASLVFLLSHTVRVLRFFVFWVSVPDLVLCLLNLFRLASATSSRTQNSFWLACVLTAGLGLLGHDFLLLFLLSRLVQLVANQAAIQNAVLLHLYLRVHI